MIRFARLFGGQLIVASNNQTGTKLIYKRNFTWGTTPGVEGLMVAKGSYPALKKVFEAVHEQDSHMITLKPGQGAQ